MGRKNQNKQQKDTFKSKSTINRGKISVLVDKLFRLTTTQNQGNITQSIEVNNQIYKVINEIQLLENEIHENVNNRTNAAILSQFTEWVTQNGANFDGLKISEFPGYDLGLLTELDIQKSSLIITVPEKIMITIDSVKKSELGQLMKIDPLLKNMPNVALSMFLLLEKFKENSFWKPYIDILPTVYSTVLYFSLDELQELQVSPTLESALKQIENIARQYAYFYKLIWNSDDSASHIFRKQFTFNQYRWAASTVMTRQNSFPSQDGSKFITALIPLWDMCNHTNGHMSTNYNPDLQRSECLAVKDFKAGEQMFIFYGARTNAELFIHNGFVYEDNEYDGFKLKLGISKSDALKDQRTQLLTKLSLPNQGEFILKKSCPPVDPSLLAFLRIFNMDKEQLQFWLENETPENLQNYECAFDTAFEKKYWGFLLARLKLILASYKTTLEEDIELIKSTEMSHNKNLAIQMRASDKKGILLAIHYAEERIKC